MNFAFKNPTQDNEPLDAIAPALFQPMSIDGVYARTGLYETVVEGLMGLITRHRQAGTEVFRFPPVMSRAQLEKSGYLKSFPHLLGCVSCLQGNESEIRAVVEKFELGREWTPALAPADLVLSPAACYPVYPIAASRGPVPAGGLIFDVTCDCFRREPSKSLDRLQSFRMREYVCIAEPEQVASFRERWMVRAQGLADQLALPYKVEQASDPFFGRGGKLMATSQIEQSLKFELLIPILSVEQPTACMSFNYHRDHFGTTWGLRAQTGETMHSGCVAFGIDRLAVALFSTHGTDLARWPASVREALAI
jgi:seryl-tRNA synthetase